MTTALYPDQMPKAPPFIPYIAEAVRLAARYIEEDLWMFFSIVASYGDEMNLIFPGARALMAHGYRAEDIDTWYERCIAAGLLRQVQERGRDNLGRWLPSVYQINPSLVYIDPARREAALRVSNIPFCRLAGLEPDPLLSVKPDQVNGSSLDQVNRNLSENPVTDSSLKSGSRPVLSQKQNQKAESQSRIREGESEEKSDRQNHVPSSKVEPRTVGSESSSADPSVQPKQKSAEAWNAPIEKQNRRANGKADKQNTPTPQPPSQKAKAAGALAPYFQPLDTHRERVAKLFTTSARNTEIEYARMYVDQYGADTVMNAVIRYQACSAEKKATFRSPAAIMVTWMQEEKRNEARKVQQEQADPLEYDITDPQECAIAAVDLTLGDDERHMFREAYTRVHNQSEFSAPWRSQMVWGEDGIALGQETDEDMLKRWQSTVEERKQRKLSALVGGS